MVLIISHLVNKSIQIRCGLLWIGPADKKMSRGQRPLILAHLKLSYGAVRIFQLLHEDHFLLSVRIDLSPLDFDDRAPRRL